MIKITENKKYYFQAFLCKNNGEAYGMRFKNEDDVILDISFGQLLPFLKLNGKFYFPLNEYFADILNQEYVRCIAVGKTKFDKSIELYVCLPKDEVTISQVITPDSMAYSEDDDIQVINYPNYTVRYKKNSKLAKQKFCETSTDMLNAVTNFVYRTGLIEKLAGYNVSIEPDKNYANVIIYSFMDEDVLTEKLVYDVVVSCLKRFLGNKVWGKYWNKIVSTVEVRNELNGFGINNIYIRLSDELVNAMSGRKDYIKMRVNTYVGAAYDGIYTKNGFISSEVNSKRCNSVLTMEHRFNMAKAPSMKTDEDKFILPSKVLRCQMFFKTSDKVLTGREFYCSHIPCYETYSEGCALVRNLIEKSDDYFEEYGKLLTYQPCIRVLNTNSYIYVEYDISENIDNSTASQRVEMFKAVWEEALRQLRKETLGAFDGEYYIKTIKRGKIVQVGVLLNNDGPVPGFKKFFSDGIVEESF